jgi:hypothetical protein
MKLTSGLELSDVSSRNSSQLFVAAMLVLASVIPEVADISAAVVRRKY